MENWFFCNYVAKLEAEERVRRLKKEPVRPEPIIQFDWVDWIAQAVKNLMSLFL